MAPNGTSRKTPAAAPKPTGIPLDTLFDDLDATKPALKDDVRKVLPLLEKPGSWDSKATTTKAQDKGNDNTTPVPMNKIPAHLAKAFPTGRIMADFPEVLRCNHCKRPVLKHAMPAHIEKCLNKKQEKQRKKKEAKDARDAAARKEKGGQVDSDAEEAGGEEGAAGAAGKRDAGGLTASKKRKAVDDPAADDPTLAGPTKKKKKKDAQDKTSKAARPKGPVDVERQCGVELPQGGQCARSLTCKSHSMGAKRGVPGRSAPYDKLLAEYQRRNQAKLQKAAFDANAPDPEDDESGVAGTVDEEAETASVMEGIKRAFGGAPIGVRQPVPLRTKYGANRIRGILASAMGDRGGRGGGTTGFFGSGSAGSGRTGFFGGATATAGVGQTQPLVSVVDANGIVHARRGSVVLGARSVTIGGGRKASVVA